jgi:hypothetical protein
MLDIRRRQFITLLGGAAAVWPRRVGAVALVRRAPMMPLPATRCHLQTFRLRK